MSTKNYDKLGRITIPDEIIKQFSLTPDRNLKITVDKSNCRMVIRPTTEEKPQNETTQEIKARLAATKQLPPDQWRLIRSIDHMGEIVLPKIMRDILGWTEQTPLEVHADQTNIYVYEYSVDN